MALWFSIFAATFALEDVALGLAAVSISQGHMSLAHGFLACFLGITLGDIGLYGLGRFAHKLKWVQKKISQESFQKVYLKLQNSRRLDIAIFVSRMIPGTRLPTYLAAGLVKYSLFRFVILTLVSVAIWVGVALIFGQTLMRVFADQFLIAIGVFIVFVMSYRHLSLKLADPWTRKAYLQSWRQYLHFEFWPAWLFYIPIVPMYVYLSLKHRSLFLPFYANPSLQHGGLLGESKWDLLKHLDPKAQSTLPLIIIAANTELSEALQRLELSALQFPIVAKPDVGQRGFGVRIIKSKEDFIDYYKLSKGDLILQQKSQYQGEAGVFFIRDPISLQAQIFSVTDKHLPFVTGDGKTSLGELILQDKRARIIAETYLKRHRQNLEQVLANGERYFISECGNHCQGAIFKNGKALATPELLKAITQSIKNIPTFHFGRLDIRYKDAQSLQQGEAFEIIEINGAGSEATHIWDPTTTLPEAYGVLYQQWRHLFAVGAYFRSQGQAELKLGTFIKDCLKVMFRNEPLSVSS